MRKSIAERLADLGIVPSAGESTEAVLGALDALDPLGEAGTEGLVGLCQELLKRLIPPPERRITEALVTELLTAGDLRALANGQLVAESIDFHLRQLVHATCRRFQGDRGLPVLPLFHPAVPSAVCGDPRRLGQLLEALLREAAPLDGALERLLVQIDVVGETHDRVTLRVDVVPQGGVTALQASGHDAAPPPSDLASGFAQLIHGQLRSESGTRFGRALVLKADLRKQPEHARTIRVPAASLEGRRVLVLADDGAPLMSRLRALGMLCEAPAPGIDAVVALRSGEGPFDAVIACAPRGGREGLEELRALRRDTVGARLRLVHLTWTRRRNLAQEAQAAGADAFLSEPTDDATLEGCLSTLLGIEAQAHALAGHAAGGLVTGHSLREALLARTPLALLVAAPGPARDAALLVLHQKGLWVDAVPCELEARNALATRPYACLVSDASLWEGAAGVRAALDAAGLRARIEGPVVEWQGGPGPDPQSAWFAAELAGIAGGESSGLARVPVLDATRLRQELGGVDPEVLRELVGAYLSDAPQHLAALMARRGSGDGPTFARTAHLLKGASLMVGALRVAVLAFELQRAGQASAWPLAERVLARLPDELGRVARELELLTGG